MNTSVLLEYTNKTFISVKIEDKRITSASFISKNSPEKDLQISKEAQKKLGWLIMRGSSGLKEASKYVRLTCNNTKLELQNELHLKGGGCGTHSRSQFRRPTMIETLNPKIKEEYSIIQKEAYDTATQIDKTNKYTTSILQQMQNILDFISKNSPSFTQQPITYRILLNEIFRIHLKFSFICWIEDNPETEQRIKQKFEIMNSFQKELRFFENKCPVLDLYFFANLIAQHYKFKEPAIKINQQLNEQAINIGLKFFSASQKLAGVGIDLVSGKIGIIANEFQSLLNISEGNSYQKMYKGMVNLWQKLQQEKKRDVEHKILFYINEFFDQKDYSMIVYILMEIYYLLKLLGKNLQVINSNNSTICRFVYIIATSSETTLTDSIKRFFSLMNNSTLARYAQISIIVELYIQIKRQTKEQTPLLDILEMAIMRRYLVETTESVKVVINSNPMICELLKQKEDNEKQQGSQLWKKFQANYEDYKKMIKGIHENFQQNEEIQIIEKESSIENSTYQEKVIADMNKAREQFKQNLDSAIKSQYQPIATYTLQCSASKCYKSDQQLKIITNQNYQTVITCLGQGLGDSYKQCCLQRLIKNDKKYVIRLSLMNNTGSPSFMFGLIKQSDQDIKLLSQVSNVYYSETQGGKVTKQIKGENLHSAENQTKIGEKTLEFRIDIQNKLFRVSLLPNYQKIADLIDDDKNKQYNLQNIPYLFAINVQRPGDSVTIQEFIEVSSFDQSCG